MLNIPFDYVLINGWRIIPKMGIKGAARATVISHTFIRILLAAMIFRRRTKLMASQPAAVSLGALPRLMRLACQTEYK